MNIRVGFGYDVHKLVENRDLWLGGIKIDYELGLLGHSDAIEIDARTQGSTTCG